jgi:hypothetical protein
MQAGHLLPKGEEEKCNISNGRDNLTDLGITRRIILKWTLNE